jgi:FixJ family two-component response regulator
MSRDWPMSGVIHVIDDDQDLCEMLVEVLRSRGYDSFAHESVEHFFLNYKPHTPTVILVDMRMPVESGLDLLKRARSIGVLSPVIFISGETTAPESVEAMKRGALDFIFKPAPLSQILSSIESAMALDIAQHNDALIAQEFLARYATLTPRERNLCPYVARDEKIKTIAAALNISEPTVKIHKSRVMKKLAVTTSSELALKLLRYRPDPVEPKELRN